MGLYAGHCYTLSQDHSSWWNMVHTSSSESELDIMDCSAVVVVNIPLASIDQYGAHLNAMLAPIGQYMPHEHLEKNHWDRLEITYKFYYMS